MVYGGTAASALGSLLRRAQEERQTGPHLVPQSAQEESPIRQQITGPIVAPESMGSEKVVALKGEMQPIQEGATAAPMGIDGTANPVVAPITPPAAEVVPPVTPNIPSDGGPTALSTIPSTFTPSGLGLSLMPSSMKQTVGKSVSQGNVLGTSTPNYSKAPNYTPVGSRTTSKLMAPSLPWVEKDVAKGKSQFASNKEWQAAQTPKQNILGGLGKIGTAITSALKLPQLLPGGAFKQLQNKMAPTVKDIFFKSSKKNTMA